MATRAGAIFGLDAATGGCDECAEAPEGPVPREGTTSRQCGMANKAGRGAVIKGAVASSAAGQPHGQLNMQPPGLNIYASQSRTGNARTCRDEERHGS